MKSFKLIVTVLGLMCILPYGMNAQSELQLIEKIETLDDLKLSIDSSSFQVVMQGMESWFPKIVSATNWQNRISKNYMFHYYNHEGDDDDILLNSLLEQSEPIYNQLIDFFKIEANTKQEMLAQQTRLLCFIIKVRTNTTFGFMVNPHTLFFYLDTAQTPEYMDKFRHEYAHWVWGRTYGEAPSLFWEGLATYAEKLSNPNSKISNFLVNDLELKNIPPLQKLAINDIFWQQKGMYTVGSLFVHYLVEQWGWEKLKKLFLISDFNDPEINEHFHQIYGKSIEIVDTEWRNYLKTNLVKEH